MWATNRKSRWKGSSGNSRQAELEWVAIPIWDVAQYKWDSSCGDGGHSQERQEKRDRETESCVRLAASKDLPSNLLNMRPPRPEHVFQSKREYLKLDLNLKRGIHLNPSLIRDVVAILYNEALEKLRCWHLTGETAWEEGSRTHCSGQLSFHRINLCFNSQEKNNGGLIPVLLFGRRQWKQIT